MIKVERVFNDEGQISCKFKYGGKRYTLWHSFTDVVASLNRKKNCEYKLYIIDRIERIERGNQEGIQSGLGYLEKDYAGDNI